MAILSQIKTKEWQLSAEQDGQVVENLDSVRQSVRIAINTQRGSVPMRPRFGVDLVGFLDSPASSALAVISQQISETIRIFLPEVRIESVTKSFNAKGEVSIVIRWSWRQSQQTEIIDL